MQHTPVISVLGKLKQEDVFNWKLGHVSVYRSTVCSSALMNPLSAHSHWSTNVFSQHSRREKEAEAGASLKLSGHLACDETHTNINEHTHVLTSHRDF